MKTNNDSLTRFKALRHAERARAIADAYAEAELDRIDPTFSACTGSRGIVAMVTSSIAYAVAGEFEAV